MTETGDRWPHTICFFLHCIRARTFSSNLMAHMNTNIWYTMKLPPYTSVATGILFIGAIVPCSGIQKFKHWPSDYQNEKVVRDTAITVY